MTSIGQTPADQTITDFVIQNTLSAFGLMSRILGKTEAWEDVAHFPETVAALRAMPENFQTELAYPVVKAIMEAVVPDLTDLSWDQTMQLSDFDTVIAGAVTDCFAMVMQSLNKAETERKANSTRARKGLLRI